MAVVNPWSSLAAHVPRGVSPSYNPLAQAFVGNRDQQRIDEKKRHSKFIEDLSEEQFEETKRRTGVEEKRQATQDAYERRLKALPNVMDAYLAGEGELGDLIAGSLGISVTPAAEAGQPQAQPQTAVPSGTEQGTPPGGPAQQAGHPQGLALPYMQNLPYTAEQRANQQPYTPGPAPMSVQPPRPARPQQPEPQASGYVVRDDVTGEVIGTFDPEAISAKRGEAQRRRGEALKRFFTEMRKGDRPAMDAAWRGPEGAASALLESTGGNVEAARKILVDLATAARKDISAERRAAMSVETSRGRALSADRYRQQRAFMGIIRHVKSNEGTDDIKERIAGGRNALKMLDSDMGGPQRIATARIVKELFSSRATNQDRKVVEQAAGKLEDFQNKLNAWVRGGELTETFRDQIKEATRIMLEQDAERLHEIGKATARLIVQNPFMVEKSAYAEQAYRTIVGSDMLGVFGEPSGQAEPTPSNLGMSGVGPGIDEFLQLELDDAQP